MTYYYYLIGMGRVRSSIWEEDGVWNPVEETLELNKYIHVLNLVVILRL